MKISSYEKMKTIFEEVEKSNKKPQLLLHSCCAPCSSAVIDTLLPYFNITVYYYNPNILPKEEYEIRKTEQQNYLKKLNIPFIEESYVPEEFFSAIEGLENLPEKSMRCYNCYKLRLNKTQNKAKALNFNFFTTTLSVSPHKNEIWINEIGEGLTSSECRFLTADFKKDNGYLKSVKLSKENSFYRQRYCGCNLT